jgi:8-oxo-dGTP pyrophosphatase MutT (NUDIX family)
MIKIVLNEKKILLTSSYVQEINAGIVQNALVSFTPSVEKIIDLVDLLQLSEMDYLIIEDSEEECLLKFKKAFTTIVAGGGLVRSFKNEFLFIYRHKKWDLPKGKCEHEEEIGLCALREVSEETGLQELSILQKIKNTYHLYIEDRMYLKETHWYLMQADDYYLTPQQEEGILKAIWVHPNNIRFQMEKTYDSVLELFTFMGYYLPRYLGRLNLLKLALLHIL